MADITHTLGIDEREFVSGLKQAEQRAAAFDARLKTSTSSIKSVQEGFQRVQGLVLGTVGAAGAAVGAFVKMGQAIGQFQAGGALLDREMEQYRNISIEINAQLSGHQRITMEIEKRYASSLQQVALAEEEAGFWFDIKDALYDIAGLPNPGDVARDRIETFKRDAQGAADALRSNQEQLAAEGLRKQIEGELLRTPSAGEDDIDARRRAENQLDYERRQAIVDNRSLDFDEATRLMDLERERHNRVLAQLDQERAAKNAQAAKDAENDQKRKQAEAERRADAELRIKDTLEDLRISQMRAQGMTKEAEIEQEKARFARIRREIEGSNAGDAAKAESLARLKELEATGLGLVGRGGDTRTRSIATGLGSAAARQVLGGNGMRTVERVTSTIARDLKELVALAKRANAPMLATFG